MYDDLMIVSKHLIERCFMDVYGSPDEDLQLDLIHVIGEKAAFSIARDIDGGAWMFNELLR